MPILHYNALMPFSLAGMEDIWKEIMTKVVSVLADDGCIVMNSVIAPKVTTDSQQLWNEACEALGLQQEPPVRIQLNDHHPITILKCRK